MGTELVIDQALCVKENTSIFKFVKFVINSCPP
jgi:hypothetical protein